MFNILLYIFDKITKQIRESVWTRGSSIDPDSINHNSFTATAWNYRWSKEYGSPPYNFSKPETKGKDEWKIEKMELREGSRKLILTIPELQICDNLKLEFHVRARNGGEFSGPVYLTIHQLPKSWYLSTPRMKQFFVMRIHCKKLLKVCPNKFSN